MFGAKKNENGQKKTQALSAGPTHALNSLVQGTETKGSIKAESDIRIDGILIGDLSCDAKLIIGPTGDVDGEVTCQNALIEGKFNGTLRVDEMLQIKENAEVTGEITYGQLTVDPGAQINGTINNRTHSGSKTNKKVVQETA